jgi:hypothetical protein
MSYIPAGGFAFFFFFFFFFFAVPALQYCTVSLWRTGWKGFFGLLLLRHLCEHSMAFWEGQESKSVAPLYICFNRMGIYFPIMRLSNACTLT